MKEGKKLSRILKRVLSVVLAISMVFTTSAISDLTAYAAPKPAMTEATVTMTFDGVAVDGRYDIPAGDTAVIGYTLTGVDADDIILLGANYYLEYQYSDSVSYSYDNRHLFTAIWDSNLPGAEAKMAVQVSYWQWNENKWNWDYKQKTVHTDIYVGPARVVDTLTASINPASVFVGETATVTAEKNFDDAVSYSSSDENIATVDENGNVTTKAAGTVTITVSGKGKTATVDLTVVARYLEASAVPTEMFVGETSKVTVDTNVTATAAVSDDAVISYNEETKVVTAVGAGSASLTFSADGVADVVINFTVTAKEFDLSADKDAVEVGDTVITTVTKNFDGAVTYSSSDEKIATVDAAGVVTAVGVGTVTITAVAGGMSDSVNVTVSAKKYPYSVNYYLATGSAYVKQGDTVVVNAANADAVLADQSVIGENGTRNFGEKSAVLVDSSVEGNVINLYYADLTDYITVTKSLESVTPDENGEYTLVFGVNAANLPSRTGKGGENVVLLIDVTRSMALDMDNTDEYDDHMSKTWENSRWYAMRTAVSSFLDTMLPEGNTLNKVTLITYAVDAKVEVENATSKSVIMDKIDSYMSQADYEKAQREMAKGNFDKNHVDVDDVAGRGYIKLISGTNHAAALQKATETMKKWSADAKQNATVVLLTDGYGNRNARGERVSNTDAGKDALNKGNDLKKAIPTAKIYTIAMLNIELGDAIYTGLGYKGTANNKTYNGYADAFYHANDYSGVLSAFNSIAELTVNFPATSNMYFLDGIAADFSNASTGLATVTMGEETLYKIPVSSMNANGTIKVKVSSSAIGAAYTNTRAFFNFTVYGKEFSKPVSDMPIAFIPANPANDTFSVAYGEELKNNVKTNDGWANLKTDAPATITVKAETITLPEKKGTVVLAADGSFTYTQGTGVKNGDTVTFNYTTQLTALGTTDEQVRTATITVTEKSRKLVINYVGVDEEDKPEGFVAKIETTVKVGDTYKYTTTAVEDYKADKAEVKGTMPNEDVTVTVTYTKTKHDLIINYVYEDGTVAAPQYTAKLKKDQKYDVTSPAVDYYTPNQAKVTGKMADKDITVTVTYSAKKYDLTVKYQYANGTKAAENHTEKVAYGSTYSVDSPSIIGYTPDQAKVSGTMDKAGKEIVVTYNVQSYLLTVNYVYEDGTKAADSFSRNYAYNQAYSVESNDIAGYTADIKKVSGNMPATAKTVTVTYYAKKAVSIALADKEFTYDGTAHVIDAATTTDLYSGYTKTVEYQVNDGAWSTTVPSFTAAGEYTVNAKVTVTAPATVPGAAEFAGYSNMTATTSAKVVVKKADVTVSAIKNSKAYGDADPTLTADVKGVPEKGDAVNYTLKRGAGENVGTYTISVVLGSNPNYNVTVEGAIFTITKKNATITVADKSKTYGDEDPEFEAKVTGVEEGETINYTLSREAGENVTEKGYAITATLGENKNYEVTVVDGTLTINKKEVTVYVDDKSKTYGDKDPEFTAKVEKLVEGDTLEYSLKRGDKSEEVGKYKITVVLPEGSNPNYIVNKRTGYLTITPADTAVVTVVAKEKTYGDADPEFEAVVTGVKEGETINYTLTREAGENVGTYDITVTLGENKNYTVTTVPAKLTINKKAATITVADKTKTYGEKDPAFTAEVTGTVGDDKLVYRVRRRNTSEDVKEGGYVIGVGLGENPNYEVTVVSGTLTINPKAATLTVADKSKTYGDADPEFTASAEGLVGEDELAYTLVREAGEDVTADGYAITATLGENKNYEVTVVPGTLTIGKKKVIVYADDATKTYGDADPEFTTKKITGVVGDDKINYTLVREEGEDVGTYKINVVFTKDANPNYDCRKAHGTLTITPADTAVVTVVAKEKTYGDADPEFEAVVTGVKEGDTINYTLTREAGENVGTYDITVTLGENKNYTVTTVPAKLTINKKKVVVYADDATKTYGDADPEFATKKITGVVGDDKIYYTLVREEGEDVGTYKISVVFTKDANPNYDCRKAHGTLTIEKKAVTLTVADATKTYGDEDPEFTASAAGLVGEDELAYTFSREEGEDVTEDGYAITAILGENKNYTVTVVDGTLTINPKAVTLTVADATKTYGDEDPEFTASAAGLVGEDELAYTLSREAGENVTADGYVITATLGENKNYTVTVVDGKLTITKKAATITAVAKEKTYGDEDPEFTAVVDGTVGEDELVYTLTREEGEDVDKYAISVVVDEDENPNYDITVTGDYLTVNAKEITLPEYSDEKEYDGQGYSKEYTVDGAFDEKITVTVSTEEKDADEHDLTIVTSADEDKNYVIIKTPSTLTVTKKAATVTAVSGKKTYGFDDPAFVAETEGVVEGDELDYTVVREEGENVGEYAMSVVLGDNKNYEITTEGATFEITKRTVLVYVNDASKKVGEADPNFTVTTYYNMPGDELNIDAWRVIGAANEVAGTYTIFASSNKENANYNYEYHYGTLTIIAEEVEEELPTPPVVPPTVPRITRENPPAEVVVETPVVETEKAPEIVPEKLEEEPVAKAPAAETLEDDEVALASIADDGECFIHWFILGSTLLYAVYMALRTMKREKELKNIKEGK